MRRKNILWGFALLVMAMVCCYVFSACGDDKDEPASNKVIGVWQYEKNPIVLAQLEQMLVAQLQQEGALTEENIQILQRVKEILANGAFVVQIKEENNEARLYAYGDKGLGVFVSGTWLMTDEAMILQVRDLVLAVTNINSNGDQLTCTIGELPLTFKKYSNK